MERGTILVVEDNPAIARLIEVQIREDGWNAIIAGTGLAALRKFADNTITLVLLDVMLPDLSGWDICESLRAESDVPIIMLTAKSSDHDVVHGLNLGADDYLAKPFTQAQLTARINAVLRRANVAIEPPTETPTLISTPPLPPLKVPLPASVPITGAALLRQKRQELGISLYGIESRSGIRWDYVQAIESGSFGSIPLPLLKQTLLDYCAFLEVDARPVFAHAQRVIMNTPEYLPRKRINPMRIALSIVIVVLIILPFVLN